MPKLIKLEPHLSQEEIVIHEKESASVSERLHWQVVRLIGQGKRTGEVVEVSGYSAAWVRALIRRYNAQGPSAIGDQRRHNQGGQRLLNAEQEADLRAEVEGGISAGEIWTGVDVARRISQLVGYEVHRARGWELLKRWGLKQRVPRPQHANADVSMQEVFKKNAP